MTTISVDDEGVWCQDAPDRRMGIRWEEIYAVSASKIADAGEPFTIVELDFDFGEYVELQDSWPGFGAALEAICARLVGAIPNWQERIDTLQPDDEPEVLWSRQDAK